MIAERPRGAVVSGSGAGAANRCGRLRSSIVRDEIPTPALLLDLDRFEANLARMAAHVQRAGKNLRPHAKSHKCPDMARRQIAAGAIGVACAKLGEAEVMTTAGIRGVLITTEVVSPGGIRRLMRLCGQAPDTLVVVDHPDNVAALARAADADGVTVNVLIDVDVGGRRTGVAGGEPALRLGRLAAEQRRLRLRGLQGYAGQCAHVVGWLARRDASRKAMAPLMETRALFEHAGLPVEIVAGGSTGTYDIDTELPGLTELQAGSYCAMDLDYRRIGGRDGDVLSDFAMALTVVATVVSVPERDRAIVDAGFKAFATDRPFGPVPVQRAGVTYSWAGDEHGRLALADPDPPVRLGERIEFFPPHCDPTFNLYDRVHALRGDRVEAVWEISARGRSD
jgi:D-serine deaminase-like pyridoxal phosphate-dependent protein